jgi:hypothetical protein
MSACNNASMFCNLTERISGLDPSSAVVSVPLRMFFHPFKTARSFIMNFIHFMILNTRWHVKEGRAALRKKGNAFVPKARRFLTQPPLLFPYYVFLLLTAYMLRNQHREDHDE